MDDKDIFDFYETRYDESARLGPNTIEFVRTVDILSRFLPAEPCRVLDIGGGAGVYAEWLAGIGHEVLLVDPIPRHVEAAAAINPGPGSISALLGDVRSLELDSDSFDVVLMLGPLYHLTQRPDRVTAWAQARRVCRDDGLIAAAVISRFASFHDMLSRGSLGEDDVGEMVTTDLTTGQHRNVHNTEGRFTTAYFHHPDEIADEAAAGGVTIDHIIGVEGVAGFLPSIEEQLSDDQKRASLLTMLRQIEQEPSIIGASAHILAISAPRQS